MLSIDTSDNIDAIKPNGDEVEFSFYTMVYRWAFLASVQMSHLRWRFPLNDQFKNSDGHSKYAAWTKSTNELFG